MAIGGSGACREDPSGSRTPYSRTTSSNGSSTIPLSRPFEVDLPAAISEKSRILTERLGEIPPNLHLLAFDFGNHNLTDLFGYGLDPRSPAVCIWQGVSYYLAREAVETTLRFMRERLCPGSTIGFDSCTPLMVTENDRVPGIRFNIERLRAIGEPYVFGVEPALMDQRELEDRYAPGIGLPENMWYLVTAENG